MYPEFNKNMLGNKNKVNAPLVVQRFESKTL